MLHLSEGYRYDSPDEVEGKGPPHELAVDLGCGTGQNARLLSPHFQKLVGIDVSESQLAEARAVPGVYQHHLQVRTAEQLPFPDVSVDLLTVATAAHWFDCERFFKEASRVLKPRGCIALLGYTDQFYINMIIRITIICVLLQVKKVLLPYTSRQLAEANSKLQDLYEAIPFPDKERVENIPSKLQMSVRSAVGITESYSMYQTFQRAEPQAAAALLESVTTRLLKEMGVSSLDTMLDVTMHYYCVLACKPQ
uniref:Zgc:162396 n=1 Tax=Astyanax mexicanus TaxID=7994 RepID=A0A3B1K902_ASTMX